MTTRRPAGLKPTADHTPTSPGPIRAARAPDRNPPGHQGHGRLGHAHLGGLLAAGLLALSAGLMAADPLEPARAELAAGNTRAAAIHLKSLLVKDPKTPGARALLVRTYLDARQGSAADEEIARALSLGDSRADWAPELAESALLRGRFAGALDLAPEEVADDRRRALLLAFQAEALLRLQRTTEADAALDAALAADPDCVQAMLAQALRAHQDQEVSKARQYVERALKADPHNFAAWSMRGELDLLEGKPAAAREAFDRAVEFAPVKGMPRYQRALAALDAEDPKAARADLEAAAPDLAGFLGLEQAWGRLLLMENQPEEALKHLDTLLRAAPNDPLGTFLTGAAHAQLGHAEQAEDLLGRWLNQHRGDPRASVILARSRLERGDPKGALALLTPLAEAPQASPAVLATLAQALAADGRTAEAEPVLVRLTQAQPDNTAARIALAESRLLAASSAQTDAAGTATAQAATDQAVADLQALVGTHPDNRAARALLIRAHLQAGNRDAALAAAQALHGLAPESPTTSALLALALQAKGDTAGARRVLTEAAAKDPGAPEVVLPLAGLDAAAGDRGTARSLLESLLTRKPAEPGAVLALAGLDLADGQAPAALERLTRALAARPQDNALRLALTRLQLAQGRGAEALSTLAAAPPAALRTPDFLLLRAQANLATQHPAEAITDLTSLVAARPDFTPARYQLAVLYAAGGQIEPMTEQLLAGLRGAPPRPSAENAIAAALRALPDDPARRGLLDQVLKATPEEPTALAERGRLALDSNDSQTALTLFTTLRRVAPESPAGVAGLIAAQTQAGRLKEAAATGEQWLARPRAAQAPAAPAAPADPSQAAPDPARDLGVRAALAQTYLKLGRMDDAARLYADIIAVAPEDWAALNNRAFILKDQDPAAALPLAERALALQPGDPEVVDTLNAVLRSLGTRDAPAAAAAAERALADRPNDPRLAATLGLLLRTQGRTEDALRVLARAYAQTPADPGLAYQYAETLATSGDPAAARTVLGRIARTPFPEQTQAQALRERLRE